MSGERVLVFDSDAGWRCDTLASLTAAAAPATAYSHACDTADALVGRLGVAMSRSSVPANEFCAVSFQSSVKYGK